MAQDYIESLGLPVLAHRLRRLSELIVESVTTTIPGFQFEGPARSASSLLLLREHGPMGVTEIGYRLRLSHPMIIKLTRALAAAGLVHDLADPADQRRRLIALTAKGRRQADRAEAFGAVLAETFNEMFKEANIDLLAAVEGFEAAAERRPIGARIRATAERLEKDRLCSNEVADVDDR